MLSLIYKYKSSYYESCKDLIKHTIIYSGSLLGTWFFKDSYVSLITIPLLSLMNIRTFIIFHDCGHNSYTPNKKLNYILGSILGIFIFTPICWSYNHRNHHLTSGNIENKLNHPQNETVTVTFKQYKQFTNIKKIAFKMIRTPLFYFLLVPILKFFILHRGEILIYKYYDHPYKQNIRLIFFDTLFNNFGLIQLLNTMNQYGLLYHYLCSLIIAVSMGFLLFHNQHTFNPPYVVTNSKWNKKDSGLIGSSFLQIPNYLKYFTGGIEYHHIHHMNSSVPGYNIQKLHDEIVHTVNKFDNITKLSMNDCYNNLWLTLYDDEDNKYISFKEADLKINNEFRKSREK